MNQRRSQATNSKSKPGIAEDIERLKQRREERKFKNVNDDKKGVQAPVEYSGKQCDAEYEKMMNKQKKVLNHEPDNHVSSEHAKIHVLVRKRPLSKKEIGLGEIDCVSAINPRLYVHECKIKVDGITKYIEDQEFYFDNAFSDKETTEDVYRYSIYPNITSIMNKGLVTCFAYGQTGSGKTFTMKGIQNLAIDSLFRAQKQSPKKLEFFVSFFEIYGGRLYDLLNNKNKLQVLEDKNQKVHVFGLEERLASTPDEMRLIIEMANSIRTTHNTVTNETSSRSHAICNIVVKEVESEEIYGKLTLVDLAGSERAQETQSNDRQRRAEGAEINKSLLALKECIRALDARRSGSDNHVPFRASKLTLVLRDSFVSKSDKSKIIMIACVNPSYSSSNHTINTLRYSDRLKDKSNIAKYNPNNNVQANNNININKTPIEIPRANPNKSTANILNNGNNYNNRENNQNNQNYNNFNQNNMKIKEIEDINMHIFNYQDDNLNDIDFDDRMNVMDSENPENLDGDDWEYLKQTVSKEGKYISDDFIRYHQITDQLVEDEDAIVNGHMNIIKDDARMLTEEGELITNIKGIGDQEDFQMDEYTLRLEKIINKKIALYTDLKKKIETYKLHVKEEDEIRRRINPKFFIDND